MESTFCKYELVYAYEQGKCVLLVVVCKAELGKWDIRMLLMLQYVTFDSGKADICVNTILVKVLSLIESQKDEIVCNSNEQKIELLEDEMENDKTNLYWDKRKQNYEVNLERAKKRREKKAREIFEYAMFFCFYF